MGVGVKYLLFLSPSLCYFSTVIPVPLSHHLTSSFTHRNDKVKIRLFWRVTQKQAGRAEPMAATDCRQLCSTQDITIHIFSLYSSMLCFIGCWFLFGQIRNQSESQKAITITFTSYLQVHTGLDPAAVRFKERLLYRGVCFEEEEDLTSRQCKVSCCILNLPSVWSPAIHIPRTKIFYWRLMKLPWSWALALLFPPTLLCKSDRVHLANFRQPFALAPSGNYLPF